MGSSSSHPQPLGSRVTRFDDLRGGQRRDVPPSRLWDDRKAHVGALQFGVGRGSSGVCHMCVRVGHPNIPRVEREVSDRKDPRNHRSIELESTEFRVMGDVMGDIMRDMCIVT